MALRWIEGFETRAEDDYWSRLYASYTGVTGSPVTSGTRKGYGRALRSANSQFTTPTLVASPENTWIVQVALRRVTNTTMSTNYGVVRFLTGGANQLELRWNQPASPDDDTFQFQLFRGATLLDTSARKFPTSSTTKGWIVVQFKVTVRNGVNGAYEMKGWEYDGTPFTIWSSTTGVNTADQGTDGADAIFFRPNGGGVVSFDMDDIVIMDSTGSVNNDFTSTPLQVFGELPNSDVSGEIDFIPSTGVNNFALVDDPDGTPTQTDEVTSDQVGDVDLYGFSQTDLDLIPTGSPPTVAGIMVDMEALMKTSGQRTMLVRFKDSTNQADDSKSLVFNTTAKESRFTVLEQNPTGTPAPWSVAVLKTIELGPKVSS